MPGQSLEDLLCKLSSSAVFASDLHPTERGQEDDASKYGVVRFITEERGKSKKKTEKRIPQGCN